MSREGAIFSLFKMTPLQTNPAHKIWIRDLMTGNYVKMEDGLNYLELSGKKIFRVNLLGVLVIKNNSFGQNYSTIILDDSTGKIAVRNFDNPTLFDDYDVGDLVLVIGKLREYDNERYVIPEIMKKVENHTWMKVREQESKKENTILQTVTLPQESAEEPINLINTLFKIIKEMDNGTGADIDLVIRRANIENADKIITELIKEGALYELTSGKVKIL